MLPRNSGWWAVWTLQPYEEARSLLGKERTDIDDPREYIFVGDGTFLMHNVLSGGELVQFVITNHDGDEVGGAKWQRTVSADEIRELYQASLPHLANAVDKVCHTYVLGHRRFPVSSLAFGIGSHNGAWLTLVISKLLCKEPEQPAIYLWDHPPARTYVSGPLCIMLVFHCPLNTVVRVSNVFQRRCGSCYDSVAIFRRWHVHRRQPGPFFFAQPLKNPWASIECLEGIGRKMTGFFNFIHDLDIQNHLDEAIALMDRNLATESLP